MWLRYTVIIIVFLVNTLAYAQMNFKELQLDLNNRINDLIKTDTSFLDDVSYSKHHVYMFESDSIKLNLFINKELPIDSLTPFLCEIETDSLKKKYLKTITYIFDPGKNLIGIGSAITISNISRDFQPDKSQKELFSVFKNPSTKMVMILGNKGIRLGYYLVVTDNDSFFYKALKTGLKELNKDEYLEIISENILAQ